MISFQKACRKEIYRESNKALSLVRTVCLSGLHNVISQFSTNICKPVWKEEKQPSSIIAVTSVSFYFPLRKRRFSPSNFELVKWIYAQSFDSSYSWNVCVYNCLRVCVCAQGMGDTFKSSCACVQTYNANFHIKPNQYTNVLVWDLQVKCFFLHDSFLYHSLHPLVSFSFMTITSSQRIQLVIREQPVSQRFNSLVTGVL